MTKIEIRFWSKVENSSGADCWQWLGAAQPDGYGTVWRKGGKRVPAHRFSYALQHGPIPEGMIVCHRCDNKGCVNPSHLFLGTHKLNTDDMMSKGRNYSPKGEDHGQSKLVAEQVREIRALRGLFLQREIAAHFGVHQALISFIHNNKIWKEVSL